MLYPSLAESGSHPTEVIRIILHWQSGEARMAAVSWLKVTSLDIYIRCHHLHLSSINMADSIRSWSHCRSLMPIGNGAFSHPIRTSSTTRSTLPSVSWS